MRAIIGHSDEIEPETAARQVIEQCRSQLLGETPKAAMLFISVDYDHQQILDAIAAEWPGLPLIGGSSDGEVSSRNGYQMDSVLLTLLCGDGFTARVGLGRNLSADIELATQHATACLEPQDQVACALTTFAPSTNASEVVRSLDRRIGRPGCPVLGGLTGDHREFARMVELCGTEVLRDSLPILYLIGDVKVSWGIGSGWFPLGEKLEVTRSAGHVVQEINGEPAIELYRRYYGEVPQDSLGEYPLAVYADGPDGPWSLRAVMGSDASTGEVRFAGEVPTGSLVSTTEVLSAGILSGSADSTQLALERFAGCRPELALLFTCAARKWVLGSEADGEVDIVQKSLAAGQQGNLTVAGLYCYGEIAPATPGSGTLLHNETCITVLLG